MKLIRILILVLFAFCFSCEEPYIVQCDDCTKEEPVEAQVSVKLSDNLDAIRTELRVYEGDIDDNILFYTGNGYNNIKLTLPINKKFTFVAVYSLQKGIYTAVDDATPKVRFEKDQCEDPCYYIYDNTVNLELKYQ